MPTNDENSNGAQYTREGNSSAAETFELYRRPSVNTICLKQMRRKITHETWEQIKTGYAAGINLREIARKMNIAEGTVLAHAKRHGWTQQIQAATGQLAVMQSDAIAPVQSVPQSLAAILGERKDRTRLGLSRFVAEAAEKAAEHPEKLEIARNVAQCIRRCGRRSNGAKF